MATFKKAVKYQAKGRVALIGPSGSGKSYSMLVLARELAGKDGTIAAVDTEHGSLSKYADRFDFDVIELSAYTAEAFLATLTAAEQEGYTVFCCDSLSHFWMGSGGALEFVDAASKRSGRGDSFSGWKEFRPYEREMVDRMISSPCHIICTMRTKNEYVEETNDKGKKIRRKIGLAPVQRDGLEYEFDLVGSMDEDNCLIVDKTRCPEYAGKAISKPKGKDFVPFAMWLNGATLEAKPEPIVTAQPNPPTLEGNILTATITEVLSVRTRQGKEVHAVALADPIYVEVGDTNKPFDKVYVWHQSMWEHLPKMIGKECEFMVAINDKGITLNQILRIGEQEWDQPTTVTEDLKASVEMEAAHA